MVSEEMSSLSQPPEHVTDDWNYFLSHHDSKTHKIPFYFDTKEWTFNHVYRVRVSNVFSPSHFWIVELEQELDCFHMYLQNFYSKYRDHYKIPIANIKRNMYCVTCTDGAYHRSVIVKVPHEIKDKTWAFAYLIDFGYLAKVGLDDIYFLTKKMYGVPQFTVRATLAGVGPLDSTTWSPEAVSKFNHVVNVGKIFLVRVREVDYINKTLFVRLSEYNYETREVDSVINQLVLDNVMKSLNMTDIKEMKYNAKKRRPAGSKNRIKLKFLYPTFADIENARVPETILAIDYLRKLNQDPLNFDSIVRKKRVC